MFLGNEFETAKATFEATNVIRLMQAAREVGLRFKNGELGKQGIIERLLQNRAMTLAAMAVIQRKAKEGNVSVPNPFSEDIAEESETSAAVTPIAQASSEALQGLEKRVESCEKLSAGVVSSLGKLAANVDSVRNDGANTALRVSDLETRVQKLSERTPVVFNINGCETPQVSGQHHRFPELVKWLSLRKIDPETRKGPRTHILLIGPASSGKTTAALEYAQLRGLELYAQPLTMDSFGVVGYTTPEGKRVETEFTRAWINGGVFLWDELSMSAPEAIGTLNSALANGFIPIPGLGTVYAHPDFYCIAGDNSDTGATLKYGARSLLDGASLDRFVTIEWEIDPTIEENCAGAYSSWLHAVRAIRAEIAKRDIQHVGATMRAVITGAMALSAGMHSRREILDATCKKGALREQWGYFEALPAVQTFLKGF